MATHSLRSQTKAFSSTENLKKDMKIEGEKYVLLAAQLQVDFWNFFLVNIR